jgi:hypothetical protein
VQHGAKWSVALNDKSARAGKQSIIQARSERLKPWTTGIGRLAALSRGGFLLTSAVVLSARQRSLQQSEPPNRACRPTRLAFGS